METHMLIDTQCERKQKDKKYRYNKWYHVMKKCVVFYFYFYYIIYIYIYIKYNKNENYN